MSAGERFYIPPLRFHALTPAYDALVRWTCAERKFRDAVIQTLARQSFGRLVDVGCGTGSLLAALSVRFPGVEIVGVDADEAALRIAQEKMRALGCSAALKRTNAVDLPFPDKWADAVTASLFFHHLDDLSKDQVLREVHRCLIPGGLFVVADWDRSESIGRRAIFNLVRALDGFGVTAAHADGRFVRMVRSCGFSVRDAKPIQAPLGQITVWSFERPAA